MIIWISVVLPLKIFKDIQFILISYDFSVFFFFLFQQNCETNNYYITYKFVLLLQYNVPCIFLTG